MLSYGRRESLKVNLINFSLKKTQFLQHLGLTVLCVLPMQLWCKVITPQGSLHNSAAKAQEQAGHGSAWPL